jgi:hypothetical protein
MGHVIKLGFDARFAALAAALLLIELAIARFVHDAGISLFAFAVELGQYFDLVTMLGLQHNRLARIIIGTTFDVRDLLAYAVGGLLVLAVDAWRKARSTITER